MPRRNAAFRSVCWKPLNQWQPMARAGGVIATASRGREVGAEGAVGVSRGRSAPNRRRQADGGRDIGPRAQEFRQPLGERMYPRWRESPCHAGTSLPRETRSPGPPHQRRAAAWRAILRTAIARIPCGVPCRRAVPSDGAASGSVRPCRSRACTTAPPTATAITGGHPPAERASLLRARSPRPDTAGSTSTGLPPNRQPRTAPTPWRTRSR
jgi:hypothetical protein